MNGKAVAAFALAGVVAFWVWSHFLNHGPVPTDDVASQLAEDEWGSGFCYDHDTQWPCIIPTDISLDRSDNDYEKHDRHTAYRRCFDVYVQVESTKWDYTYGGPSDPRTYVAAPKPFHACGDIRYAAGDSDKAESWSLTPTDDPPWYSNGVDALHQLLCSNPPYGAAYACLP